MMTLSDFREWAFLNYWTDLHERHETVAAMAAEAGVSPAYAYTQLARYRLPTPRGK